MISVTAQKRVYIFGKPMATPQDVTRYVEEELRKNPEKTAFVKGDVRTTYGAVHEVMEAVHKAGLEDVLLGTDEIKEEH